MSTIPEMFGTMVFNDTVMRQRLPKETYKALKKTIDEGKELDLGLANVVANAMKDWACEKGATHYTHWFQSLNGTTSEKHDSFINPTSDGGVIMEFSGKELIKGESDASSFPSGGLRATCEARGYTAWDPTSPAFIKDDVLCIPTAFCSYTGEALDKKTPLLRSMSAISGQARRILHLFGKDIPQVSTTVGAEQEYFLIDKNDYARRLDLMLTGRTLFGCPPAKGQELDEHYFGTLRTRVSAYMKDLDDELWKLGILAKTKHNEAAPAQHELAPIFTTTNIAVDTNLLTMEMMKKVAERHDLVCLLHEKPFAGVSGSGKHNNWSISAPGVNLLDPGKTPADNLQFLIFLTAVIKAVDEYQDLLRVSVATAGNDHRLGANEAPPATISMFLGDEMDAIIDALADDVEYTSPERVAMDLGVAVLPKFTKDNTDRNRTSPFAFTGNKFEFRMPGSSMNVSDANIVLNTAVAKILKEFADELEQAEDFSTAAMALIKKTLKAHKHIIFNGNGYSDEWIDEAARRGIHNFRSTVDALPAMLHEKNVALFEEFGVLSPVEMHARYEVMLESYAKVVNIEALTMLQMANQELMPAISAYTTHVAEAASAKRSVSAALSVRAEVKLLTALSDCADRMSDAIDLLADARDAAVGAGDALAVARAYRDRVIPAMEALRGAADAAEQICGEKYWPLPNYSRMLWYVDR
ncbi:MAG: glutamine synthetase III [Oscillospiraceae bacterium]|nr:glutamine synthetase III [Oscillospiraceae bacterium]